mgnify:CR=1 FL=1
METITKNIPALALRGLTVFPRMTASFDVEREISVRALERAMETGQEFAESEFEQYRVVQDQLYQSDFDRLVASTEENR